MRNAPLACLLIAMLAVAGCSSAQSPPPAPAPAAIAAAPVTDRDGGTAVQLKTTDGTTLGGHLYGHGDIGVIMAHQYNGDQTGWTDFAMVLAAHGYGALTFDFRGFPESGPIVHVPDSITDLQAAYDFMRQRSNRIFIIGASMGSDAAILLGAKHPPGLAGIILLSTPIEFMGVNVYDADAIVAVPMLFIETTDDPFVAGQSEILFTHANAPKAIKIYSGNEHGAEILKTGHGAELRNLILQFIADHSH